MKPSRLRPILNGLLILGLLIGSPGISFAQPTPTTSATTNRVVPEQTPRATAQPPAVAEAPLSVEPAVLDDRLAQPPAPAQAVVVNADNPNWVTVYGSEAGAQLLPPRQPDLPMAVEGATPPLSGTWLTSTTLAGAGSVTAAAYAPDGRLFAGVGGAGGGLRVYAPDINGFYSWSTISGAPASATSTVSALTVWGDALWVGSSALGVRVYNLSTNTWVLTFTTPTLPSNAINRFTAVDNPNGVDYLWVSTSNGAAKYTGGRAPSWDIFNTADGLPDNYVYDVAVKFSGAVTTTWFATQGSFVSWNGSAFTTYGSCGGAFVDFATRVIVDRLGQVWTAPWEIIPALPPTADGLSAPTAGVQSPLGVCKGVPNGGGYNWTIYNSFSPGLPSNYVNDLSEDFMGRVWMATDGGTAVHDLGTWAVFTPTAKGLYTHTVKVALAADEIVWFGNGNTRVMSAYSPNWVRTAATTLGAQPGPLYLDPIRTWAGVGNGLAWSQGNSAVWTTLPITDNTSPVSAFARDGSGALWIGTAGNGVYLYDGVSAFQSIAEGLPSNTVRALLKDHLGRIWVGTDAGLAMRAEAGYWITFTTSNSSIASNTINALARDSADRLWIGTPNGISILDLSGMSITWETSGLPSAVVNALATSATGEVWVGTDIGLLLWTPANPDGTFYSVGTGALPDNRVTHLTVDDLGRVWVGTRGGVVLREGEQWKAFHVPGSLMVSNQLTGLASDSARTWIAATGNPNTTSAIAVRGVLTKPIGNAVPNITSFSPTSGSPGDKIILTGTGFDDRGKQFNVVRFTGPYSTPYAYAEVVSVTQTSLAVRVPALASSGKLFVSANGFNSPQSAVAFALRPTITSLSDACIAVGSELKISGVGLMDGSGAAFVKIGNGAERIADATDPTQVRVFIRPGDTAGPVQVRLTNGNTALSANNLGLTTLEFNAAFIQQALEDEWLVWGKRTLTQLQVSAVGCGDAQITRANAYWMFKNGTVIPGGVFTTGKTISSHGLPLTLQDGVALISELNLSDVLYHLNLDKSVSSLQYFDGMSLTLRNNLVNVLTVHIPASQFDFVDTALARYHLLTMQITGDTPARQDPNYEQVMMRNMAAAARIFPQQDGWWYGGPYGWLQDIYTWTSLDYRVRIDASSDGNEGEARGIADDYIDPGENTWGVAFIDQMNLTSDSGGGLSSSWWDTVVAVNATNLGGRYLVHEWMHAMGFVDSDAPNYLSSSVAGEDNHSKYNEGRWDPSATDGFDNCMASRAYRQALSDFSNANRRVVRLSANNPGDLLTAACNDLSKNNQSNTAKSVISYAPNRNNFNTVLEPIDYRELLRELCQKYNYPSATYLIVCPGYPGYKANAPAMPLALTAARTLRLSGQIDFANQVVTPSVSYVSSGEVPVSPQEGEGELHLIVRAADNSVLHDQIFRAEDTAHPAHDAPALRATHVVSGSAIARFNLRVPFPDNAVKAELSHHGEVLWSATVSPNAPTVNLTAPNGGTFSAMQPITVTWTSGDADNDPLQFGVDYSADGGATWILLAPKVTGDSFAFTPNWLPASAAAKLRVRASDGFNTASAESSPFTLQPRAPEPIILEPLDGQTFNEGDQVAFRGTSFTSDGQGAGTFAWKQGAQTLGVTDTVDIVLQGVGVQTFTLQVVNNSLTTTRNVTVTVIPDYDHDGLPNAWESQNLFNPLDASDAAGDADGDTLSNGNEFTFGTNPRVADTDGDTFSDSAEIAAGTDPLKATSQPLATPALNVGSSSMGFTVNWFSPLPEAKDTMVTNLGGGVLTYTASVDAAWLNVSPLTATAPQTLTVNYDRGDLASGVYVGYVTVSAPGVAGSPQTITVTLTIAPLPPKLYLPLIQR